MKSTSFSCTLCGECCRGEQKVWLNPADLERLARHLGWSGTEELAERRIVVSEVGEHGIRRLRLRFKSGPAGTACPFIINDLDEEERLWSRCSLHETAAKPLVCRLAPLSREIDLVDGTEKWFEIPPVIGCPGWGDNAPPADGIRIADPVLTADIRSDLDDEAEYFRKLSSDAD
jgi:Fe-S-cluster containining protein